MSNLSKRMAYVLRHNPGNVGLTLDPNGWVRLQQLAEALKVTADSVEKVISSDNKTRYGTQVVEGEVYVRANQGHSIPVNLQLETVEPPEILYHGTVEKFIANIRNEGLRPQTRHAVHLSGDLETARTVGARRGNPIILTIQSGRMHRDGIKFERSANGVWLTAEVNPTYITFEE